MLKKILKEPLLHFLLLGAVLFVLYQRTAGQTSTEPSKIVVTQGQILSMAETFARTWQRPPTAAEWQGLIQDRVREEIYAREALSLGLDRDDTVIRRRLRQKMEFIADDVSAEVEPTAVELDAYLQAHRDAFRVEPRVAFSQVYLNPGKHGENLARDAADLLARLQQAGSQADISALGDQSLLEQDFSLLSRADVAKQFGEEFAVNLTGVPLGQWQGPISSGFGAHLVFLRQRIEGSLPPLADVREIVRREWANERRTRANEKYFQDLLKRYVVTIETPAATVAKEAPKSK